MPACTTAVIRTDIDARTVGTSGRIALLQSAVHHFNYCPAKSNCVSRQPIPLGSRENKYLLGHDRIELGYDSIDLGRRRNCFDFKTCSSKTSQAKCVHRQASKQAGQVHTKLD